MLDLREESATRISETTPKLGFRTPTGCAYRRCSSKRSPRLSPRGASVPRGYGWGPHLSPSNFRDPAGDAAPHVHVRFCRGSASLLRKWRLHCPVLTVCVATAAMNRTGVKTRVSVRWKNAHGTVAVHCDVRPLLCTPEHTLTAVRETACRTRCFLGMERQAQEVDAW